MIFKDKAVEMGMNNMKENMLSRIKSEFLKRGITMKCTIAFVLLLIATVALAKRIPTPVVSPIEYDGIRYIAPNENGRVAYLEAWDIKTGKQLWVTAVYRNRIKFWLEEDVQWVFIKKLELVQNELVVTDERERSYNVDLKTGHVQRSIVSSILSSGVEGKDWFR